LCIYRYIRQWYIAIIGVGGDIGSGDNDIYRGVHQESVPIDGWVLANLGREPCPVCRKS